LGGCPGGGYLLFNNEIIMKRYLVFSFPEFYPSGGMEDFIGDFDRLFEAMDALSKSHHTTGHVYDTIEKKIVFENLPCNNWGAS
jgi:hypothetical protein